MHCSTARGLVSILHTPESNQSWTSLTDTERERVFAEIHFIAQLARKSMKAVKKSARKEIRIITAKLNSMPAVVCQKCGADQSQCKLSYGYPESNRSLNILAEISEEISLLEEESHMSIESSRRNPVT
jgi:hypothetical protein